MILRLCNPAPPTIQSGVSADEKYKTMAEQKNNGRSSRGLSRAIIGTAAVSAAMLVLLLFRRSGPGPVLVVLPWFIPLVSVFQALTYFSVVFLALGRYTVLRDPTSFWIGSGAAGFGISLVFYALTWPGVLPDGGSVISGLPGTPVWILQIGLSIFSTFLLAAVMVHVPIDESLSRDRFYPVSAAWVTIVITAFVLLIHVEPALPPLITVSGIFRPSLLVWNGVVAFLFGAGALLSTFRYRRSGDPILGYIAFAQIGFAFATAATFSGMRRYDPIWYLLRAILTGSALVVFFGLLSEYVRLIRREKENTAVVRKAEAALRESEERYRILFESIDEGYCIIEMRIEPGRLLDYRFIEVNAAFEKQSTLVNAKGRWMRELRPEHEESWFETYRDVALTGKSIRFEQHGRALADRWFTLYAFRIGEPEHRRVAVLFNDITERKRTEENLRKSEERLALVVKHSPDRMFMQDRDLRYVWIYNPAGGLTREAVTGKTDFDLLPSDQALKLTDVKRQVLATGNSRKVEYELSPGGVTRWYETVYEPYFDQQGEAMGLFGYSRDITDRKAAEKDRERLIAELKHSNQKLGQSDRRFRELADSMPQLVWTARPDGQVDYYNIRHLEFEGIRSGDDNWIWEPVVHPDDARATESAWRKAVETGTVYEIEHRVKRSDGGYNWFLSRGVPVRNDAGEIIKWYGTATDINTRKVAEDQLQTAHDELELRVKERTAELEKMVEEEKATQTRLEQVNRELSDFIYVAAHDLQEPLRKIQIFADWLVKNVSDDVKEDAREYLIRMHRSAGRMQSMVLDLLRYSRFSSKPATFSRFNLREPVDAAIRDSRADCAEVQCRFEVDVLPDIEADKEHMHQLFYLLMDNGIKFRNEKPPLIRISHTFSESEPFLEIHVKDNGIGFDPAYLDKIFKPFQRLHGKDKVYPGNGMGLAICRRIVEVHGGSITADSKPGDGATFIVKLPRSRMVLSENRSLTD